MTAAPQAAKCPVLVSRYRYQEQAIPPFSARLNYDHRRQQNIPVLPMPIDTFLIVRSPTKGAPAFLMHNVKMSTDRPSCSFMLLMLLKTPEVSLNTKKGFSGAVVAAEVQSLLARLYKWQTGFCQAHGWQKFLYTGQSEGGFGLTETRCFSSYPFFHKWTS